MRCPAAPYHEEGVASEVKKACLEHGLEFKQDRFGNLLVSLCTAPASRPLVLAAHMDHPGFDLIGSLGSKRWRARFLGGVPDDYFRRGVPVRLLPGNTKAKLGKRVGTGKDFELELSERPVGRPRFGVWDLEDFAVRRGRIHGRACDDLIGVAAILATLIDLKSARRRVHMIGVISRAEEVGFHGALAVAASRELPSKSLVISLETSRELPPVRMGRGVIIRVGDRSSVFDSDGSRFLNEVAEGLKSRVAGFPVQRALMSGGTCEATAYQEYGLACAAVCVALGNYHNCAPRSRIAAEFVSLEDACGMVSLLSEAARRMPAYAQLVGKLPKRLGSLLREAKKGLLERPIS